MGSNLKANMDRKETQGSKKRGIKSLLSAGGALVIIGAIASFAPGARASGGGGGGAPNIPTGAAGPSPMFGIQKFTQPMPRFDVLERKDPSTLIPAAAEQSNQTQQALDPALGTGTGPIEGRPPGPLWAHQGWSDFPPKVAVEVNMQGATVNNIYNPGVSQAHNSGIDPTVPLHPRFHPGLPDQDPLKMWTFNGTIPPKLVIGRYGEPILFREHNLLPADKTQNGGFGIHTISTHEHNGHHGAENDGFTGAFFFPGQFYDYHWPIVLAGFRSINTTATDPKAGSPDDALGIKKIAGDWHETMSTHWFHDHMFSFTSQNVYKGMAAMFNIYSAIDRGNEALIDGVNLRLPSGSAKGWANLDYDVNLVLADKAWDANCQLWFNPFDTDGFLGDRMTVNLADNPYFVVEARKYRFRILNGAVSRFFKLALSDGSPMIQIANDGNLLPSPVVQTQLDEQGIAERYDIVIDFSRYHAGDKVWMVNLCEHHNGKMPAQDRTLADALAGKSVDPAVGKFLEFRVVAATGPDLSQVPATLIPNPTFASGVTKRRQFNFGSDAVAPISSATSFPTGPWGVKTDMGTDTTLTADYGRISAAPKQGTREMWTLVNNGAGWDHPVHIHFEEGQIQLRDGLSSNVPAWEKGRKDVYRLRPGGSVTLTMQFRDWGGTFMEHCHNTVHEDNAMLVRCDIDANGASILNPFPSPIPTPNGCTFVPPDEIVPTAY